MSMAMTISAKYFDLSFRISILRSKKIHWHKVGIVVEREAMLIFFLTYTSSAFADIYLKIIN
jgi:hypothetical protein